MASATKLPSGAWRTQANKKIGGKMVRKSFTVHPKDCPGSNMNIKSRNAKAQSELLAREWILKRDVVSSVDKTVEDAIDSYIEDRTKVLSPSSIVSYKQIRQYFEPIFYLTANEVTTPDIQKLINEMSVSVSAKTIKTRIGLLLSALDYAGNTNKFKLRYPQSIKRKLTTPDTDAVQVLLSNADDIMKPIICLAALGSLRRGEIAALRNKDISHDMNTVVIHADMVRSPDGGFVLKEMPKTSGSVRSIQLPRSVMELIPRGDDPEGFVFSITITAISRRFERLRNKCGINVRFHDLRHYAASFRSDLNIPRKYIEEVGGWTEDSHVMTAIYDNTLTSTRKKYTQITNNYIEETFNEAIKKTAT